MEFISESFSSLGELLKEIRIIQHLTQVSVAEAAGVARTTLNRWERNVNQPRLPELNAVLDALNAPPHLREKAITLIHAPRAIRTLREEKSGKDSKDGDVAESGTQNSAWIFTPETGDLLRAMRLRTGQTQEDVAGRIGVGRHILSRWESGELIPSAERLEQLMTILQALPQERAVLVSGVLPPSHPATGELSLEEIELRLWQIIYGSYEPQKNALKDLEFLRLESALAPMASQYSAAHNLLLDTYGQHAQWLAEQKRFTEAGKYADRVIQAVQQNHGEKIPGLHWQRSVIVMARCAVYSGTDVRPERGIETLQGWLPSMDDPTFEAWSLGIIAQWLSTQKQTEASLDLAVRACRIAQRSENPTELRHRRLDRANLLLRSGRVENAEIALDLLPTSQAHNPAQRLRETIILSEALLQVGQKSEAHDWLSRAWDIAQTHDLDPRNVKDLSLQF